MSLNRPGWRSPIQRNSSWHFSPWFGGAIELDLVDPSIASRLDRLNNPYEELESVTTDDGLRRSSLLEEIHDWWQSRVSVILPQGADVRDHFGKLSVYANFSHFRQFWVLISNRSLTMPI